MSSTFLRWLSLVAVLWLQTVNGTNSNFPAYSSQLKEFLSINQIKLNYLSFASDFGKVLGFVSGVAAVHLPLWLVLLVGSFLGFAGYGLQFLCVVRNMFTLSFFHIWFLSFLAGNSICWINTVCYTMAIKNFPMNRQVAVGITASYLGLSGKIYTDIVNTFFASSPSEAAAGYLILNPVLPLAVSVITAPMLGDVEPSAISSSQNVKVGFNMMFVITVATGVYAVVTSLAPMPAVLNLVGVAVLLLAPLAIPLGIRFEELVFSRRNQLQVHNEEASIGSETIRIEEASKEEGVFDNGVGVKEEIGWKEIWKRIDFWIYFSIYLCGPTVGLVFLNNLGQIAESRACPATSSLVALSSSFGFFGRLLPSLLDYFFSRSKYMPSRPASMAVSLAAMAVSFFVLLITSNVSLYVSTAAIGVFTGAITSLSVSLTSELFGTKYFGVNHNILVGNIPIGSFLFGFLAANVYRKGANGQEDGRCMGMHCFNTTFLAWGSLCSLATVLAFVLYRRNRKFYSQMH